MSANNLLVQYAFDELVNWTHLFLNELCLVEFIFRKVARLIKRVPIHPSLRLPSHSDLTEPQPIFQN